MLSKIKMAKFLAFSLSNQASQNTDSLQVCQRALTCLHRFRLIHIWATALDFILLANWNNSTLGTLELI